jgi:hypothetical protein
VIHRYRNKVTKVDGNKVTKVDGNNRTEKFMATLSPEMSKTKFAY